MSDGSTPRLDTFLAGQRIQDTFCGFSADEIEAMPMIDYARIRERAGLDPIDPYTDAYAKYETLAPHGQDPAPAAAQALQEPPAGLPQGLDPNSDEYFLAWRAQRVSGGEGRGIFDSVGSRSDEYTAAVRNQVGRTAYGRQNVIEPPRLEGRYINHDEQRDTRTAAQRFSTPGNAFGL